MVERFFRELTEKQLKRGVFNSVKELQESVMTFIEKHNKAPAPYIWTKSATDILEKVKRGRASLNKLQTVWRRTLVEIIKKGVYKGESRDLFGDEFFSCGKLSNSDIVRIYDALELDVDSEDDAIKAAKEITPLLAKCPGFGEFNKQKTEWLGIQRTYIKRKSQN